MPKLHLALAGVLAANAEAFKVAFLGDSAYGADAATNYRLMREAGVKLVLQNGDFDYESDPAGWDQFLDDNWFTPNGVANEGALFLGTSGNHEQDFLSTILSGGKKWLTRDGYKERFVNRLRQSGDFASKCTGRQGKSLETDYGEYIACELDDVLVIGIGWDQISDNLFGPGGDRDLVYDFLETTLAASTATWKLCVWHRPEGKLNPGDRHTAAYGTERAYQIAAKYGCMVTSGHSHVYGRTKLVSNFDTMEVSAEHDADRVKLGCGQTISVVNGMGGTGTDGSGSRAGARYMERVYTDAQGDAKNGVLICDFTDSAEAPCEFLIGEESRTDHKFDSFTMTSPPDSATCVSRTPPSPPTPPAEAPALGASGCLRNYARGWALAGPSKYNWCGGSCCAAGAGANQPCYYTVPNPAECGNPSGEVITSSRVRSSTDDVEEFDGKRYFWQPDLFYTDSSDIEFMDDKTNGRTGQMIGLRFQGVEVPAGAAITDAYLVFEAEEANSGEAGGITIAADLSANSPAFTADTKPSQRTLTSSTTKWDNIEPWGWRIDASTVARSVSFSDVVQEVVSQDGWASGNAISIILKDGSGKRSAKSYDNSDSRAPLLVVKYSTGVDVSTAAVAGSLSAFGLGAAALLLARRRRLRPEAKTGEENKLETENKLEAEDKLEIEARRPSI